MPRPTLGSLHECHRPALPVPAQTVLLLNASNVFMTFAWYGELKTLSHKPLLVAVLVSWGIAFFCLREPLKLDYLWAGLCMVGAVYFIFRRG